MSPDPVVVTHTVDAATDWVYVALEPESLDIVVIDPATSTEWDIAFRTTDVMLNGGAGRSGDVSAVCICQNFFASAARLQGMTPETELTAFSAVSAADIPADPALWDSDAFVENAWFRYNLRGQHLIWPTFDVYLVRRRDDVYKLQIVGFYGVDDEPRQVTFRFAKLSE